jgi:hypothetical protein
MDIHAISSGLTAIVKQIEYESYGNIITDSSIHLKINTFRVCRRAA